jgi:hypothetical protein
LLDTTERNADVGVVLRKIHRFPAIVPHTCLVLAKTIEGFIGTPQLRVKFCVIALVTVDYDGPHRDFGLFEESLSV